MSLSRLAVVKDASAFQVLCGYIGLSSSEAAEASISKSYCGGWCLFHRELNQFIGLIAPKDSHQCLISDPVLRSAPSDLAFVET